MSIDPKFQELNYDTVIPSLLIIDKNIEPNAKLLYGIIRNLTKAEGYCWASNDSLAEIMDVDISTIKRWIKSLRDFGYIEIEHEMKGIVVCKRYIYISDKFKKYLRRLKNEPGVAQNRAPYIRNKEDIRKGEEAAPPPPPPFEYKRIKMTVEKFDALVSEFGKEKILEMCDRLNEYADINPKRFKQYACHGTVIRKWIREDKEKAVKFQEKKVADEKENEQYAKRIAKEYPKLMAMQKIDIGYNYIEFKGNTHSTCIKFSDKGFREQVINELRKLGIPIKEEK